MSKLTLSFKGKTLKVYPVPEGEMLIGSDPQCTVHIDSLAVQPRHARIVTRGHSSVLFDLDTPDGTFVNQERISEYPLKGDEIIRIGKHTLSFTYEPTPATATAAVEEEPPTAGPAPAAAGTQSGPRSAWLQILSGQNLGKNLSLNRAMTNLGKPGVARAVIARRADGYFLSHLEGRQVPKVGDRPIGEKAHKLKDGDIIQIGNVKMQFYYE